MRDASGQLGIMLKPLLLSAAALALLAAGPPERPDPAQVPDPAQLKATVERLVGFGTRHTLSGGTPRDGRGIDDAIAWSGDRFTATAKQCGKCLRVETVSDRFSGPRAPDGVDVFDVLAVQPGSGDSRHVVIVMAHIDSRVTDVANAVSDAPGANDNGSGSALVLEAARILSKEKFQATIVYALLSGEEQGLWGGRLMARIARERGWKVAAVLNNDIVGNSVGQDGRRVDTLVRVFSEGARASEDLADTAARRGNGGEDDGPSRALAKAALRVAAAHPDIGLEVLAARRPDRFGRGGDHLPMLDAGHPAIRITVGVENYDAQHQDLRTEAGRAYGDTIDRMDFAYLAKVTALNVALLRELASAPPAPERATIAGAVATDTTVTWEAVPAAAGYRIRWRRNDSQDWQQSKDVAGDATRLVLPGLIVDDHFVAVSALSASGAESITTFAGAAPR